MAKLAVVFNILICNFKCRSGCFLFPQTFDKEITLSTFVLVGQFCIRPMSITKACYDGKYYKVASDVLALVLVYFCPYGRATALTIDICTELYNFHMADNDEGISFSLTNERFNPKIRENAIKILGIPEDKLEDKQWITKKYEAHLKGLREKRSKAKGLGIQFLDSLIVDTETAYKTVTEA